MMIWLSAACLNTSVSRTTRSEEHTSELQSQSNLVCRLLLEKKKNKFVVYLRELKAWFEGDRNTGIKQHHTAVRSNYSEAAEGQLLWMLVDPVLWYVMRASAQ